MNPDEGPQLLKPKWLVREASGIKQPSMQTISPKPHPQGVLSRKAYRGPGWETDLRLSCRQAYDYLVLVQTSLLNTHALLAPVDIHGAAEYSHLLLKGDGRAGLVRRSSPGVAKLLTRSQAR